MKLLLAVALFVVAAQASQLIPRDVEVAMYPRLTGQAWENLMHSQKPTPENYLHYKRGSVPQSRRAGQTAVDVGSRIINGSPASRGQFPWQVAVRMDSSYFCGGSLVSETWVLTAGHCVDGIRSFEMTIGATKVNDPESNSVTVTSRNSILHSGYNGNTINNDIGVIKLSSPVAISSFINMVRLPSYSLVGETFTGVSLRISGWGKTSDNAGGISPVLNFVDLTGISNSDCAKIYGNTITASKLCTLGENDKATCSGDSGGPLVYQESDGRYTQVGIVSFGASAGCSVAPSAFTRVTSFLQWIESNTDIAIQN